jgi:hypothetical protein
LEAMCSDVWPFIFRVWFLREGRDGDGLQVVEAEFWKAMKFAGEKAVDVQDHFQNWMTSPHHEATPSTSPLHHPALAP